MAGKWGVDTREWKSFQEKLEKISQNSGDDSLEYFLRGYMVNMAERVLVKTKPRTPVGTPESTGIPNYVGGTLRRNWQLGKILVEGKKISVEILNPTEYATEVEYGHRIMGGAGHSIEVGWKDGRFMLTTSVNEIRAQMPMRFAQQWKDFCKRWGL